MIKRTLEISKEPAHLSVKRQQLLIKREGETISQVPCEDIGMVLVDNPATTYTHSALTTLAQCGATVVICGRNHLPAALLLPLADHTQIVWRQTAQIAVTRPIQKRLWQQIIQEKIIAQSENIDPLNPIRKKLRALAKLVRSGDPSNVEARAAKEYWKHWLGKNTKSSFHRDQDGDGLNSFLNYGYAVLRAALARAIVAAGLLPALGIHHKNRSNAFCLADDLIEPLRAIVDRRAKEMHELGYEKLSQEAKAMLLELLTIPVQMDGETGPLMVNLHRYVSSLVRCYEGESKRLEIPKRCK